MSKSDNDAKAQPTGLGYSQKDVPGQGHSHGVPGEGHLPGGEPSNPPKLDTIVGSTEEVKPLTRKALADKKYIALVNPSGQVVTFNNDSGGQAQRMELLRTQKPAEVDNAKWWRDATEDEAEAYAESSGHHHSVADRADWRKRQDKLREQSEKL